jgi:glycerate dehydrogenase
VKAVLLNARRLDFDDRLDFGPLAEVAEVVRHEDSAPGEIPERARGCAVLVGKELPLGAETIAALPEEVGLVCEAGTGFDNVDLAAAAARGLLVCNVPGYSTGAVAQLALCQVLSLLTGVHRVARHLAAGDEGDFRGALRHAPREVEGKVLGVVGAGAIGRRVIRLARAFGMRVLVHTRSRTGLEGDPGVEAVSLDALLAGSDVVSLHCPLSEATRHVVRRETLARMRPGAFLVNTARGGLVHQGDLVEALASGHLAGAALDVQDPEPLPAGHPLWSAPNVLLTPHVGWKALEARRRLVREVAANVRAWQQGTPRNVVGRAG